MHLLSDKLLLSFLLLILSPRHVSAWWGDGADCDEPWNGTGRPGGAWWGNGYNNNDNDGNNDDTTTSNPNQASVTAFLQTNINNVLIAHAVMACLAWAFFIPLGGILLRLPSNSPNMLRLHVVCQMLGYVVYVAAAGLGIWLAQQISAGASSAWADPHPGLGIGILVVAFAQPILGYVHHALFKRRRQGRIDEMADTKHPHPESGDAAGNLGTTAAGRVHVWVGRLLLVLGIVNGGLGIRLAARLPSQSADTTRNAAIGYGIGAGIMFLLYVLAVALFEKPEQAVRGEAHAGEQWGPGERAPPSYTESEESATVGKATFR